MIFAIAPSRIAHDERTIGAKYATVQRACDRHEIGLAEEHERGVMVGGEIERVDRVLDDLGALRRPPEDASDEAAAMRVRRWSMRVRRWATWLLRSLGRIFGQRRIDALGQTRGELSAVVHRNPQSLASCAHEVAQIF